MKASYTKSTLLCGAFGALTFALTGCADLNSPYYDSGGYYGGDGYYDRYDDDYYNRRERDRLRHERRQLERERERAHEERDRYRRERRETEEERERAERERERAERERREAQRNNPPARVEERCPAGFTPSENKCSAEERRRGCKDMRLKGGLGCVKR